MYNLERVLYSLKPYLLGPGVKREEEPDYPIISGKRVGAGLRRQTEKAQQDI